MDSIVARRRDLEENLDSVASDAFDSEQISGMSDADVAELLAVTGRFSGASKDCGSRRPYRSATDRVDSRKNG